MPDHSKVPPSASVAADLRVAIMRLARRLRSENASELPPGQYSVLVVLEHGGAQTPSSLAAHENVQPPSMTRTISQLEEAGLVARETSPHDRRQSLITITDAGRDLIARARKLRTAWLSHQLENLDAADLKLLARATKVLGELSQK